MKFRVYPCSKNGKILKGFCPTVCCSISDFNSVLKGWMKFSKKFGIRYYCTESSEHDPVVLPLPF